jgi:hypothetical protein
LALGGDRRLRALSCCAVPGPPVSVGEGVKPVPIRDRRDLGRGPDLGIGRIRSRGLFHFFCYFFFPFMFSILFLSKLLQKSSNSIKPNSKFL